MRLLLADALSCLPPEVLAPTEARQIADLNAVCERLILGGKWDGTILRWRGSDVDTSFAVQTDANDQPYITLPRQLANVSATAYGTGSTALGFCTSNHPVRNQWFDFSANGFPAGDRITSSALHDAGGGYTVFRDFVGPAYLRVVTESVEEVGASMLFRGLDENSHPIYTGTGADTYEGVELDISTALTTTTTQKFIAPPTLIRKPVTRGPVRLYAVDVTTAVATLIGMYDPGEKSPSFRRYRLGTCATITTFHALSKRRHVPALADADEIIPGLLPALESGLMARRFQLANEMATAVQYWTDAFGLLNAELGDVQGSAFPRIQFQPGEGYGAIPRV